MFANGHYDSDDGGPSGISNVRVEMGKPKPFGIMHRDKRDDLLVSLQETKGKNADEDNEFAFWKADYKIRRSKHYTFGVELTPYWEPAEDVFIFHGTKVFVESLGRKEGWGEPAELLTEIIPMTQNGKQPSTRKTNSMHDVNYHHHHELTQHEFLGCCRDCQRSLDIIKPHIMGFANKIREYDDAALRALPPDDLYRLFLLLDDLAHMDAGEHLSEMILAEPEINASLPEIRSYYNTFFSIHEVHLAQRLLRASTPWETLKSFPLYPRYEALVKNQIKLHNIDRVSRLAFIGCGPVPSSLILLNHLAGIRSVGLEIDDATAALSRQVVFSLGLERQIDIVHGDETVLRELDWNTILVAAMAMPKKRIFDNLRRIMKETGKIEASVFYRTYTGMRTILHTPVTADDIGGFTIVGRYFPMGRVNNTVVIAKMEE